MPEWKDEIKDRLASLKLDPTREAEIVEELSQHLEDRNAESLASGAAPEEASSAALAELSGSEMLERELRRVEREAALEPIALGTNERRNMIADFWQDLRYAVRTLRNYPGFAAVIMLTMAIGIGVNTTFFSLFSLFFRPAPANGLGAVVGGCIFGGSLQDYAHFRDHNQVFSGLIASAEAGALALGRDGASEEPQRINGELVSDNFFSVLGARTVLGRAFAPEENRTSGRDQVVVLSYPFWQSHLGADPHIVGKTLRINTEPFVVIGVTAPDFVGLGLQKGGIKDVWLPLMLRSEKSLQDQGWLGKRDCWLSIAGRLKPSQTLEEANAEMRLLWGQLHPSAKIHPYARVVKPLYILPWGSDVWTIITVIMSATAMVLLIACSNIANLMLARAARRQKEIGVRLCLGASRGRLVRQLLTESLLLAVLGAATGLLLAWWSLKAFLASAILSQIPSLGRHSVGTLTLLLNPDARILSFTFLLALLAGLAFGLLPALRATRPDLASALKDEGAAFGRRMTRSRLRNGLVVAQVALSMVLLIASGLLLRGLIRGSANNLGFETKNLLSLEPRPVQAGYDKARAQQFRDELAARFEALPGVRHAPRVLNVPLRVGNRLHLALLVNRQGAVEVVEHHARA
ncbi:MAG TPA: ABC transporter permease, partial [Blastocatellia bacterium]|nr:ABC transporter permease [Blastocatellia bacterium]